MTVKLLQPDIPDPEAWLPYLQTAYDRHHFSNFGPNHEALCEEIATFQGGGRHAVLAANATLGMAATIMALGIKGRIALPAFTFPATASAVALAGCMPVAVDADPISWEMAPDALDHVLAQGGVSAVIHVRSFGFCRDLSPIEVVVKRHNLPLIIDAAAAFGGESTQGPVGDSGVAEVFSMHATKPFAAGEGCTIMAASELVAEIRNVINFSMRDGPAGSVWGMNAKLSEFGAAVGRAALDRLPDTIAFRRRQAAEWHRALSGLANLVQLPDGHGNPPWQLYALCLPGNEAEAVRLALQRDGIESRVYYSPTVSSRWDGVVCPQSEYLATHMLSLPMGRHLDSGQIDMIADRLGQILTGAGR